MNAERLLANYERIADAPEAIGRVRRFVLDLAVRGKLMPQDPKDEPASELLKRIAAEKARLLKTGEIRSAKPIPALGELPFPLPVRWCWSQIAELGVLSPRNEASDDTSASFVPMPLIAAEYGVGNKHEIRPWGEIKKGYTHFAEGDVGLAKITPCFENGKSTVFRRLTGGIGSGTTELHVVRPLLVNRAYLLIYLKSPYFIETGIPRMTGTAGQKRVPAEYFAYSPFPLPPLAEQHRIVAKVDELMALCDRLETARAQREAMRDRLTSASLARLNVPDPDTFQERARFVLKALPALTRRPDQIKQIRQTILNLAVRGKLVQQDPKDEPALELLKRTAVRKDAVAHRASTKTVAMRIQGGTSDNQELPITWCWTTTESLCEVIVDCPHSTPIFVRTGVVCLDTNSIKEGELVPHKVRYVSEDTYTERVRRLVPCAGDLVFAREGSVGASFIVPKGMKCCLGQRVMLFRPKAEIVPRYFSLALSEPSSLARLLELHKGIGAKHVNVADMRRALIPLPPTAEQHRIVAKVDELMALCDRLEASLVAGDATRRRLLDAVLAEALAPANDATPLGVGRVVAHG
jgi:type I restriction enzyme S subunit